MAKLTVKAFQEAMREWIRSKHQTPDVLSEHLMAMHGMSVNLRALQETLIAAGLPTDPDSLRTALVCKAGQLQAAHDAEDRAENARKAAEDARDELRRIINYAIERILKR